MGIKYCVPLILGKLGERHMINQHVDKKIFYQWVSFAFIALGVLLVYFPSLTHVPRSDQIIYLSEVAHLKGFKALVLDTYDLNRHRKLAPGDQLLFRPLLYVMLGVEKFFFGYQFWCWQLVGVILHLAVIWQLLALLLLITPAVVAIAATALFATFFSNMEMVIWHHINAYLVFVFCWVFILRRFYLIALKGENFSKYGVSIFCASLISCFIYEAAVIYTVLLLMALRCLNIEQRRGYLFLCWPPILYFVTNIMNWYLKGVIAPEAKLITAQISAFGVIKGMLTAFVFWIYAGLFGGQLDMIYGPRNVVVESSLFKMVNFMDAWVVSSLFISLAVIALIVWPKTRQSKIINPYNALLVMMILSYMVAIVCGRAQTRGLAAVLSGYLYYPYVFWLFFLPLILGLINWQALNKHVKQLLLGAVLILIAFNGQHLYQANVKQADENNDILVLINTLELLIKEKGQEPDFSFYVAGHYPGNYEMGQFKGNDNQERRQRCLMETLYPQYFNDRNPKYRFLTKPNAS